MGRKLMLPMAILITLTFITSSLAASALETLKEKQAAIERAQEAYDTAPADGPKKQALDRAVRDAFDFEKLARESIAGHWNAMTAEQREQYIRLFRSLVLRSTIRKLEEYRAAETHYTDVVADSTHAVITTVVTSTSGEQVAIQYKLHRNNGRWWVWDTTIGLDTEITEYDVSTAENYRSAFNKLVGDEGIEGLLNKLREKNRGGSDL